MLKRVAGLHGGGGKKQVDPGKSCENDEAPARTNDTSPDSSGDIQWCDYLSFKTVCVSAGSYGGSGCSTSGNKDAGKKQLTSSGVKDDQTKVTDAVSVVHEARCRKPRRMRVFNFHYLDSHIMEFKPSALTRRFCGHKKPDNELYRSNSFKFERFDRTDEAASLQKQVSLCDDYSLPVDFVNKKRPHSFGAGLANWTTPSPNGDTVEVVETYSDPRDSKAYLEPGEEASGKLYTSPDRDYSQPYTDGSSEAKTPEEIDDGLYEDVGLPSEEPCDTVNCVTVIRVGDDQEEEELSLVEDLFDQPPPPRRNPSPYYYGDLFRDSNDVPEPAPVSKRSSQTQTRYRKSVSLDAPASEKLEPFIPKRNSFGGGGASGDGRRTAHWVIPSSSIGNQYDIPYEETTGSLLAECVLEWDTILMPPHRSLRGHDLPSVCSCTGGGRCISGNPEEEEEENVEQDIRCKNHHHHHHHHHRHHHHRRRHRKSSKNRKRYHASDGQTQPHTQECPEEEPPVDYDLPEGELDEFTDMSGRQRHVYETAFDCRVSRSDDDLDDMDRVTNHPILQTFSSGKLASSSSTNSSNLITPTRPSSSNDPNVSLGIYTPKERRRSNITRGKMVRERPRSVPGRLLQADTASSTTTLSQEFEALELEESEENCNAVPSPSPSHRGYSPSPPSTAPLPMKFHNKDIIIMNSIGSSPNIPSSNPGYLRLKDFRLPVKSIRARELPDHRIMEFKGRPRSMFEEEDIIILESKTDLQDNGDAILEFKGRPNVPDEKEVILEFKGRPEESNESGNILTRNATTQDTGPILEFKGRPGTRRCGVRPKYSSTESMATSSSGGSLESIRSSTSEGNRSTTSSDSRRSSSLSSHSSDSASSCGSNTGNTANIHHLHHLHFYHHHQCTTVGTPMTGGIGARFFSHQSNKLHILSPISDKSSQEPASETSDNNRNNNSQKASPEDNDQTIANSPVSLTKVAVDQIWSDSVAIKPKRRTPQNKNLIALNLQQQSSSSGDAEIQGSDSGISIESRGGTKGSKGFFIKSIQVGAGNSDCNVDNGQQNTDLSDLPFDMPKLRRRRLQQQDTCTSGSATSVDLQELPFDMPKLRRRLRGQLLLPQQPSLEVPQTTSTESSGVSQASSSQSVKDSAPGPPNRPALTLNLENKSTPKQRLGLSLSLPGSFLRDSIDVSQPLERQGWYHGAITRTEAENILRLLGEGSFLVRNSESTRQDYSLSLKSARGFMHMRIQQNPETGKFILGQFSKPFDSIPEMIRHYTINRLPIRGAEHMCLLHPVIEQLL